MSHIPTSLPATPLESYAMETSPRRRSPQRSGSPEGSRPADPRAQAVDRGRIPDVEEARSSSLPALTEGGTEAGAVVRRGLAGMTQLRQRAPTESAQLNEMLSQILSEGGLGLGFFPSSVGDQQELEHLLARPEIRTLIDETSTNLQRLVENRGRPTASATLTHEPTPGTSAAAARSDTARTVALPANFWPELDGAIANARARLPKDATLQKTLVTALSFLGRGTILFLAAISREYFGAWPNRGLHIDQKDQNTAGARALFHTLQILAVLAFAAPRLAKASTLTAKAKVSIPLLAAALVASLGFAERFGSVPELAPLGAKIMYFAMAYEFLKRVFPLKTPDLGNAQFTPAWKFAKDAVDNVAFTAGFVPITVMSFRPGWITGSSAEFLALSAADKFKHAAISSSLLTFALMAYELSNVVTTEKFADRKPVNSMKVQPGLDLPIKGLSREDLNHFLDMVKKSGYSGLVYHHFTMILDNFTWPFGDKILGPASIPNDQKRLAANSAISLALCLALCFPYTYAFEQKPGDENLGDLRRVLDQAMTALAAKAAASPDDFNPEHPQFLARLADAVRDIVTDFSSSKELQSFLAGIVGGVVKLRLAAPEEAETETPGVLPSSAWIEDAEDGITAAPVLRPTLQPTGPVAETPPQPLQTSTEPLKTEPVLPEATPTPKEPVVATTAAESESKRPEAPLPEAKPTETATSSQAK